MKQILLLVAVLGFAVTSDVVMVSEAVAETEGMERRDDRRDDREDAREGKRECKAGDENSRSECRQGKRDDKRGPDGDDSKAETEEAKTESEDE